MLPTNRQAGLPAPRDRRGKGQGGIAPVQLGRVTYVHRKKRLVDVILDDLTVIEKVKVMGADHGPDRGVDDLPGKRSLVVVLFPYGVKDRPLVAGVLERPGKTLKEAAYEDTEEGGFYRRVFPSGVHLAVHPNGRIELRAADGTYFAIGENADAKDDFTGQAREAWDGDPFNDPPAKPQAKPAGFHAVLKRPDGTRVHLQDGAIHLRVGGSGLVIDGAGVTIVGPSFGWQATPLTKANFTPAGSQFLVPLPNPSPFILP